MPIKIEAVTPKLGLGEGPFWDADSQCLYFVDVLEKHLYKYSRSSNTYTKAIIPAREDVTTSSVTPVEGKNDQFLIGAGNELLRIQWDGVSDKAEKLEVITELKKGCSLNDARADFSGRLWIGYFPVDRSTGKFVVPEKGGGLYTVQSNKVLKKRLDGVTLANGLDWSKSQNSFYFVDSLERVIMKFDYNPDIDDITNKQIIFDFGVCDIEGIPDGMAIDENDNLWVATYGGSKIVNIDPTKPNSIIQIVDMPVNSITSVAFGGPNLDELYVTTPSVNPLESFDPLAGGYLYRITGLGVRGYPGRKAKFY